MIRRRLVHLIWGCRVSAKRVLLFLDRWCGRTQPQMTRSARMTKYSSSSGPVTDCQLCELSRNSSNGGARATSKSLTGWQSNEAPSPCACGLFPVAIVANVMPSYIYLHNLRLRLPACACRRARCFCHLLAQRCPPRRIGEVQRLLDIFYLLDRFLYPFYCVHCY